MKLEASNARRWAGLIGAVCGVELFLAVLIGGAGMAVFFSLEGALVVVLLGGVTLSVLLTWLRAG